MPAFVERIIWHEGRQNDEVEMGREKWKKISSAI